MDHEARTMEHGHIARTLLLVRHSVPEIVPEMPAREWPLSHEGRRRCAVLAERLAPFAPRALVASTEPKARETAELVAARLGLDVATMTGLHEHDRYNVPYLGRGVYEERLAALFAHPNELVFGRETATQALARFEQAVQATLAAHPAGTLAIVTHGTVLTLYVAARTGIAPLQFWRALGLPALVALDLPQGRLVAVEHEIA